MKTCQNCKGKGFIAYDHNHCKPCQACCNHDKGWFLLHQYQAGYVHGADNACCLAGCGQMRRSLKTKTKGKP